MTGNVTSMFDVETIGLKTFQMKVLDGEVVEVQ